MRRNLFVMLVGLSLLIVQPAIAADYSAGVTSKVLSKTTVTGNGQKISYPLTGSAEEIPNVIGKQNEVSW